MEKKSWINKLFNRKNNEVYLGKLSDKSQVKDSDVSINLSPEQLKSLNLQGADVKMDPSKITNRSLEGVFIEHIDLQRQKELEDKKAKASLTEKEEFELKELYAGALATLKGQSVPVIKEGKVQTNPNIEQTKQEVYSYFAEELKERFRKIDLGQVKDLNLPDLKNANDHFLTTNESLGDLHLPNLPAEEEPRHHK